MEFEQIIKQLEWLDNEHRKDKETISALQIKVASLESMLAAAGKQIKGLDHDLQNVLNQGARDMFDEMLGKLRVDVTKAVDDLQKQVQRREAENKSRRQVEMEGLDKLIADVRSVSGSSEIKLKMKEQSVETERLVNNFADIRKKFEEQRRVFEETSHQMNVSEEARRQELKRMTDLQAEFMTQHKRADESRQKITFHENKMNLLENRLTELLSNESKREQAQYDFFQQQNNSQAERDRAWKDWRDKYAEFQKEAGTMMEQVQTIDETLRNAKRAQETYLELNTKLERRINEVMELQRLAEDRMRQEWITFKGEDQKRWTGYTLSSEENFRDLRKDFQKLDGIVSSLDELSRTMQDQLQQTTDTTEQQLQELMNIIHQWMSSYERIMGHDRKSVKKTGA
jgi:chromosome segregation ATPase